MYKIAVCDDNPSDLILISDYLSDNNCPFPVEPVFFQSGIKLADAYKTKGQFDLIILDMIMDGMNGLETAKQIRQIDEDVMILIVTATVEYALDGYEVNAIRYLVKPVEKENFQRLLKNIFALIDKKKGLSYTFPSKAGTTSIALEDIYYFESDIHSLHICARQGDYRFTGRISAAEKQIASHGFLRVHKSFLVNLKHVHNIFKDSITMDNGEVIPLSRHRHKEINQRFLEYMEEQML